MSLEDVLLRFFVTHGVAGVCLPFTFLDLREEIEALHGVFEGGVLRKVADGLKNAFLCLRVWTWCLVTAS